MRNISIRWRRFLKKTVPLIIAPFAQWTIRMILKTCTIEFQGTEHLRSAVQNGKCIIALWHNYLAPAANFLDMCAPEYQYAPVISGSRDGEILTRFLKRFKQCRPLRVAHDARHVAVPAIKARLKEPQTIVVITPDGPRGPRHQAKQGATSAARETGAAIVPMKWSSSSSWTLNTWDQMMIPKPFSTICVRFTTPLYNSTTDEVEKAL